jgi:hypothetical protein
MKKRDAKARAAFDEVLAEQAALTAKAKDVKADSREEKALEKEFAALKERRLPSSWIRRARARSAASSGSTGARRSRPPALARTINEIDPAGRLPRSFSSSVVPRVPVVNHTLRSATAARTAVTRKSDAPYFLSSTFGALLLTTTPRAVQSYFVTATISFPFHSHANAESVPN